MYTLPSSERRRRGRRHPAQHPPRRASPTAATTTPTSGRRRSGSRTRGSCARPGVNLVSLPVFSWPQLETAARRLRLGLARPGHRRALGGRHPHRPRDRHRDAAALAIREHPEMLPWNEDGQRLEFGSRQAYCPSSPVWREHVRCAWPAPWPSAMATTPRSRSGTSRTSTATTSRAAGARVVRPLPPLARGALRRPRRAERGVGRERAGASATPRGSTSRRRAVRPVR